MKNTETKHDRFVRLAEKRVNNALKSIELVGNLSNTGNYEYSISESQKIVKTLKKAVDNIEKKFSKKSVSKFKL